MSRQVEIERDFYCDELAKANERLNTPQFVDLGTPGLIPWDDRDALRTAARGVFEVRTFVSGPTLYRVVTDKGIAWFSNRADAEAFEKEEHGTTIET